MDTRAIDTASVDRDRLYMLIAFTLAVLITAYGVLLSPPFKSVRAAIGLPEELEGARYNDQTGAADLINPDGGKTFLGRITFVYHSIFAVLILGSYLVFTHRYVDDRRLLTDIMLLGALLTVFGGITYSYITKDFMLHGLFIAGLTFLFVSGMFTFSKFKPSDLVAWNIYVSGILLLMGAFIGGWLGASFMKYRGSFLNALIEGRFDPSLPKENIFWRALTAHEHAMMAIALALVFFIALSLVDLKGGKLTRYLLYLAIPSQVTMALASYSVWFIGGIAHLAITPAALLLIFSTLLLSLRVDKWNLIKAGLITGNAVMWIAVAIPGALVAMSLRKPLFFNPEFRAEVWNWAELAYNIGHWHILLLSWGVMLLVIYMVYPVNLGRAGRIAGYLTLAGYFIASTGINLYMLGNPPGEYIPNPYDNIYLSTIVEPGLGLLSMGVVLAYFLYLKQFLRIELS